MTRPEQPTVADVLKAAQAVAATHEKIAADHRAAIDNARPEESGQLESTSTESSALG